MGVSEADATLIFNGVVKEIVRNSRLELLQLPGELALKLPRVDVVVEWYHSHQDIWSE